MSSPQDYVELLKNAKTYLESTFDRYSLLKIAASGLIGSSIAYGIKIWYTHGYFARRGIKTPKYHFFGGNLPEIYEKTYTIALKEWTEIYGKTYGYYEGNLPVLVTSDLNMIEEVFYKQFSNFTGRKKFAFMPSDKGPHINLFMASQNRWKRMRAILNPTFVPARLRELTPEMQRCIERLNLVLEKNLDNQINISEYFDRMVMDIVWNSGFGIDTDIQNNPSYPLFVLTRKSFEYASNVELSVRILMYFNELKPFLLKMLKAYSYVANKINKNFGHPFFVVFHNIHKILTERLKRKIHRKDYAQMLIDAQTDNFQVDDCKETFSDKYDPNRVQKKLTYNEVIMNLVLFLNAGFETTSVTLSTCAFVLAKYPEEMRKLQAEVDSLKTDTIEYDTLAKLEYLDLFIKEVQRMYPIAAFSTARKCTTPTNVCGLNIEKGLLIAVDVISLHYDPKYWGPIDPKTFYPMRFAPENNINKLVYMPFGGGPRSCLGQKFALLEIKLTLVHLLKRYDILAPPGGIDEIEFVEGLTRRTKYGIKVVFKERSLNK